MRKNSGFTLIELLVVIVIIGVLSTISTATFTGYSDKAREARAIVFEREAEKKLIIRSNFQDVSQLRGYDFEEGSGNVAAESSGLAAFARQNGSAYWENDTVYDKSESAFLFQGSTYLRSNNPSENLSEFTLSLWLKPSSINSIYGGLFYNGNCGAGLRMNAPRSLYYRNPGTCGNTAGTSWSLFVPDVLVLDRWQHVLFTDDGTESRLYVDGELVGSVVHAETQIRIGNIYTGLMYWGGSNDFAIDNFRMWRVAYIED